MWSSRSHVLALALHFTTVVCYDYGSINQDAEPYVIAMVNNASVGPDGMSCYQAPSTHKLTKMFDRALVVHLASGRLPVRNMFHPIANVHAD